jgi:predicted Zn-dependent protease with MMP-like domain
VTSARRERLEHYRSLKRRARLDPGSFNVLVERALSELPPEFRDRIDNVAIVIEDRPSSHHLQRVGLRPRDTLLGLYEGIPFGQRGSGYTLVPPDRITLFREPILAQCATAEQVVAEVRQTVLHELGHYFGLSDAELR